jgi:hypothetical protein
MKIHQLERAKGVHPRMLVLLQEWLKRGPFEIVVGFHGGLRTDPAVQSMLSGGGMSAANSLRITPHGRGGALDLWPLIFLDHVPSSWGGHARRWSSWEELPHLVVEQFAGIVTFSEALGFTAGARWRSKSYANGDNPHHELHDWQRLPFPAPVYEFPADLAAAL